LSPALEDTAPRTLKNEAKDFGSASAEGGGGSVEGAGGSHGFLRFSRARRFGSRGLGSFEPDSGVGAELCLPARFESNVTSGRRLWWFGGTVEVFVGRFKSIASGLSLPDICMIVEHSGNRRVCTLTDSRFGVGFFFGGLNFLGPREVGFITSPGAVTKFFKLMTV
jgi:hypothetical protein